ncbi:YIP1 family protein [Cohnella yongneupensis]|uniref:YIP1 family protein n=1 Tax=Cohnella yongneupensis TaxID=425006 RepID=A0ABW0R9L5_9BACL
MMKARLGKSLFTALLIMIFTLSVSSSAFAEVPYRTYAKDSYGKVVSTQPAFYPAGVIGKSIYIPDPNKPGAKMFSPMRDPQDIFIDGKDEIYIADTGNNRIVHFDAQGQLLRVITVQEHPLSSPTGVFVTDDGQIYIADKGNHRLVHLDPEGGWLGEFKKPDSKFVGSMESFDPVKVIVDKQGFVYVVVLGDYRGLMKLNAQGGFESFFGANQTQLSFSDALKKKFYTRKMYARELSKHPSAIVNATADTNGFLYTVSGGSISSNQVKKFNVRGKNMLANKDTYALNYSSSYGESLGKSDNPQLTDIAVDRLGNMIVADSVSKFVSEYDQNGNLMFFWAGNPSDESTQLGLIKNPVSVAVNSSGELFILDNQEGIAQKFRSTEFGSLINQANLLTNDGKYAEAESLWKEVLRLNSKYDIALLGLAKAAYQKEDYREAMRLFKEAGNQQGYSDSYWQIRLQWFQNHFATAINVIVGLFVLWAVLGRWARKIPWIRQRIKKGSRQQSLEISRSSRPLWQQLKHVFYMVRHPIEGFTGIKFEGKGGYRSAAIILMLVYASLCLSQFYTSFVFNRTLKMDISLANVFVKFFAVWILWVVANYLTSSISKGEGTFKNIFVSSAYCLIPYLFINVPLTFMSNGMTFTESSIYGFLQQAIVVWTALLFFWQVQTIHNYTVYEAIVNIVWTVFAMIVFGVLLFITYGLTGDLKDFIISIYKEAAIR